MDKQMKKIQIKISNKQIDLRLNASLNESRNAKIIFDSLPLNGTVNFWGDEIYSKVPVELENQDPKKEMEIGDLAYWPEGNCICIFFGRTPASTNEKPVAASPVTQIGKIDSGLKKIKNLDRKKVMDITFAKKEE